MFLVWTKREGVKNGSLPVGDMNSRSHLEIV